MQNKQKDVFIFGSITLDIFVRPKKSLVRGGEFRFAAGEKFRIDSAKKFLGGAAPNVGIGLKKLGLQVGVSGVVGSDAESKWIKNLLEKNQVSPDLIVQKKDAESAFSLILNDESGRRTVFHHRDDRATFPPNILDQVESARAIYFGHLYPGSQKVLEKIPKWKSKNKPAIFAWNPGKTQFESGFLSFEKIWKSVDFLILNGEELRAFSGESFKNLDSHAKKFLEVGVGAVVATDGAAGAHLFTSQKTHFCPATSAKPVSTLGAGDAFSAGFLASVLHGNSLEKSMIWGTQNASATTQKFGAQNGQLGLDEIRNF